MNLSKCLQIFAGEWQFEDVIAAELIVPILNLKIRGRGLILDAYEYFLRKVKI